MKLSKEIKGVIGDTQDMVLKGFLEEPFSPRMPGWVDALRQVASTADDLVTACLGSTGQRLKAFAQQVNLNHPDLELFFDSIGQGSDLYKAAADIISRAKVEKEASSNVKNEENDLLGRHPRFPQVVRMLQQPRTRLLCSPQDRFNQRAVKKQIKAIGLKNMFSTGENAFYGRPDHFKRYARNSKFHHEEMKELVVRQECFASFGMTEMAHAFAKRMRSLEESIADTCGFYRLKPDEAAVMLARLHGFRWNDGGVVTVSSKFFDSLNFWPEGTTMESGDDPQIEQIKKNMVLQTKFVPNNSSAVTFNYQPRMYPLSHFPVEMPDKAKSVLVKAEGFSGLGNNPFFDYFWVLVPSISLNHQCLQKPNKDSWTLKLDGTTHVYKEQMDAAVSLDKKLVKDGYVVPVIIGERDGKCYFLCMWN